MTKMLTPELFKQAVDSATDGCTDNKCIHEEAMDPNIVELRKQASAFAIMAMATGRDPLMSTLDMGIHIGYRLHQLETDPMPLPTGKVN